MYQKGPKGLIIKKDRTETDRKRPKLTENDEELQRITKMTKKAKK